MIEQMNPCSCGGCDFPLSHSIDGDNMIVTVRCNGCQTENEYTINMFDAVSDYLTGLKCINKVDGVFCEQENLTVVGSSGALQGGVPGKQYMTVKGHCSTCSVEKDYKINLRDAINLKTIAPHNAANNPI